MDDMNNRNYINNPNNDTEDQEKKNMKMRKWDNAVTIIFIAALVIIAFFWKCHYDPIVTVVAGVIVAAASLVGHNQFKKIKELSAYSASDMQQR